MSGDMSGYAELHCLSNFSFQRGASSAGELFERAQALGYTALAITDECSLAGIVRAWEASKKAGMPLIIGSEVRLVDGLKLILLAADRDGYCDLCRLITTGRRRSAKGEYRLTRADVEELGSGVLVLWIPEFPRACRRDFSPDASAPDSNKSIEAEASPTTACTCRRDFNPDASAPDSNKSIEAEASPTTACTCRRDFSPDASAPDSNKSVEAEASPTTAGIEAEACPELVERASRTGVWLAQHFPDRAWIAVELHQGPNDATELAALRELGKLHDLPLVAAGNVHMHARGRRALQDALTAIRIGRTVANAGHELFANGERHLRRIADIAQIYPPELVAETRVVAARCTFKLDGISYEYPHELVPPGFTATTYLRCLTEAGMQRRWPQGVSRSVHDQIERELQLIAELRYEHFFLTVQDIVAWARAQSPPILCQGRGSSANSAVCFCLGITAVDPASSNLLFERFISRERREPPDIDVDFEHERREEVIQYVFAKYGRERAALAATVISYRGRSAVRDVGRALGLAEDQLDQLSRVFSRVCSGQELAAWLHERGFDPGSRVLRQLFVLVGELRGVPRHLSQHVGGFVISEQPLHHLVPVENAAMPDRTIIQWDKDDLESLRLLKVDCLALGMLTCLRKCFDLLRQFENIDLELATIPRDDNKTWDMICAADTIGVFQIESRAQMAMLPRLRPRCFYDLVIQVAIVRPGPIQGNMVHPYLRRRNGQEPIDYPKSKRELVDGRESRIKDVLGRTLGVPIFQEQVMRLVEVVADFTPGEADQLRRAMAAWKRRGGLESFRDKIHAGMRRNGYEEAYFERLFEQIQGFGDYGFPESHSASFALLAWASSWLKCHYPAAFACALLNSQPMGFYQPAQIVQDVQRHHVTVLPVDVATSEFDCTLEKVPTPDKRSRAAKAASRNDSPKPRFALRLGFRQVRGLSAKLAERIVLARNERPFSDLADVTRRARVSVSERTRLADAGAMRSLSGNRHRAHWESTGLQLPTALLAGAKTQEQRVALRAPSLREDVMADYASLGLSLNRHPLALIRAELERRHILPALAATNCENRDRHVRCAGLVTVRQHPGTAKGVTFVTLEDETGQVNVVIWRKLAERQHRILMEATVMGVDGVLQASEGVHHLIAHRLHDFSALLPGLGFASRDFC